jgi:hypothetical protein
MQLVDRRGNDTGPGPPVVKRIPSEAADDYELGRGGEQPQAQALGFPAAGVAGASIGIQSSKSRAIWTISSQI